MFASEDITFCGNNNCANMECFRNPKYINLPIPHSFALFEQCEHWDENGAAWLIKEFGNLSKNN